MEKYWIQLETKTIRNELTAPVVDVESDFANEKHLSPSARGENIENDKTRKSKSTNRQQPF